MARIDEARLLGRMKQGVRYWQVDILRLFNGADEEQRCECLESLGSLVSSRRVQRTYARGCFSYVKQPECVLAYIDAKEHVLPEPRELDRRTYEGYSNDLGSHRDLAMLARGGR